MGTSFAVEFTADAKANAGFGYLKESGQVSNPVNNSFNAGISVFCEIDFVNTDNFKFGIRPEVGCLADSNDWEIIFVPRLPLWFTFSLSENFDLTAGPGFDVLSMGPTFDLQAAFRVGPGKFIINPSLSLGDAINGFNPFVLDCSLGLGYQYTFGKNNSNYSKKLLKIHKLTYNSL